MSAQFAGVCRLWAPRRSRCLLTLSLVASSSPPSSSSFSSSLFHLPFHAFVLPFSPILDRSLVARVNGDICRVASEFGLIGPCTGAR